MHFKRTFTEPVPKDREAEFVKAGISKFHGRARFVAPSVVEIGLDRHCHLALKILSCFNEAICSEGLWHMAWHIKCFDPLWLGGSW